MTAGLLATAGWMLQRPRSVPAMPFAGHRVLVVTDAYAVPYVSDPIDAFRNTGAEVTVLEDELNNGTALQSSLIAGYDLVVLITMFGTVDVLPIDDVDIEPLASAIRSHASRAFLVMTDACSLCSVESSEKLLAMWNGISGWPVELAPMDKDRFNAELDVNAAHSSAFADWPSILGNNFSALTSVPERNVIYRTESGVLAAVLESGPAGSCVFFTTDTTPFVSEANGTPPGQADGLAAAYLSSAMSPDGPCR